MARSRILVVFVDALGVEQLRESPALLALAPHRRALRGVLGYSSGALATLLTGEEPERHGRMCLFARAERAGDSLLAPLRFLGLLPRVVHERGRVRRLAARWLRAHAGLGGYVALHRVPPEAFAWLDLPERDDLFASPDVGGAPTFLGRARAAGKGVYASPWQLPEPERRARDLEVLRRSSPDLTFLYATALDGALHEHGPDAAVTRETLRGVAEHASRARDALAADGSDVTTWLVGDHGMAEVRRAIDPRPLTARLPAGLRYFVDSTFLRVWGEEPALGRAGRALEGAIEGARWLDRISLAARRAPTEGSPYGDAMLVLPEGSIFAPSWVGGRVAGMHGYDVGSPSSRAALASSDPLPEGLATLADVAPRVLDRLGLSS